MTHNVEIRQIGSEDPDDIKLYIIIGLTFKGLATLTDIATRQEVSIEHLVTKAVANIIKKEGAR